ncbi:MAG: sodium/proton-translocating pyrophosphatase, partial [Longimicrobiales bacterium]
MTDLTTLAQWAPILGVLGLMGALVLYMYVSRQSQGNDVMAGLAQQIHEGAMAFLRREYSVLSVFVLVVAALLWWAIGMKTSLAYITGALSSV